MKPATFALLSGCPIMDIVHGRIGERWGLTDISLITLPRVTRGCRRRLTPERWTITSLENIKLMRWTQIRDAPDVRPTGG
jgi:hypothetical protein